MSRSTLVVDSFLGVRLDVLRRAQNPDGGWSYYCGKQSWLEPTFYGALVLHGDPAADRAWSLIKSWQQPDGSWPPAAGMAISGWGTALCLNLAHLRGEVDGSYFKGVAYLLKTAGTESELWRRALAKTGLIDPGRNLSLKGWPWKEGTSSWVEPTAHTLIALKKAYAIVPAPELTERIHSGEALLLDVRCKDGGWNYGSPWTLGEDQRSYPETTALALLGLQGRAEASSSVDLARRWLPETPSSLARAWITIALRLHEVEVPDITNPLKGPGSPDLMVVALEALGSAEGNYRFLKTEKA
ncbi:MAG: hypothetical protein ACRD4E_06185 [Bryobacteraceae bacterium]